MLFMLVLISCHCCMQFEWLLDLLLAHSNVREYFTARISPAWMAVTSRAKIRVITWCSRRVHRSPQSKSVLQEFERRV
jgi:hypothetical protein